MEIEKIYSRTKHSKSYVGRKLLLRKKLCFGYPLIVEINVFEHNKSYVATKVDCELCLFKRMSGSFCIF